MTVQPIKLTLTSVNMEKFVGVLFFISFALNSFAAEKTLGIVTPEKVYFKNGALTLGGLLYMPPGSGRFPVLLYNHGSAPGSLNDQAAESIAPYFLKKGWAFFMPYRRGQGLSSKAGPYIGDEIDKAKTKGMDVAASTMLTLLKTDHFNDQMSALNWLKAQSFVDKNRIAVAGNSFGGIETVLGVVSGSYCAGIDASGGAESWESSPELQILMKESVKSAKISS